MSFMLGFGSTELEIAPKIIRECVDAIQSQSEATPEQVVSAIDSVQAVYDADSDRYAKMDRSECPERYTHFFYNHYPIYEGKCIITFTMHHINRRHGMSPDGWALLATSWVLVICPTDGVKIFKEA